MYVWNVELVLRSEMCHSLYIGTDGQLQFAPHTLRGLTWLAEAHELLRLARGRDYIKLSVVRTTTAGLAEIWATAWHDVLVLYGTQVCFGPLDEDGWRWTLSRDIRVRAVDEGWELWRCGDEEPSRYASWDDVADNWW